MATPHFVFWMMGIVLILVAVILRMAGASVPFWLFWGDLALNVGVSVMAVSIIDFLWRKLGGDPITSAIHRLHTVTALLRDLEDSGIERLYARRDLFQEKKKLIGLMRTSHEVDMMGITLQHDWANNPDFTRVLRERVGHDKCRFRIMVFHPDSEVAQQREKEEADEFKTQPKRISQDARVTLETLSAIRSGLPAADQPFLEVRAVSETNLYCSVIRIDDRMLISQYLMSRRGSKVPTIEITGSRTPFFEMYAQEFERMWKLAVEWSPPVAETPHK